MKGRFVVVRAAVASVILLIAVGIGDARFLRAQDVASGDWEPTGPGERVVRLFTTSGGVLFAWREGVGVGSALVRSDDGGGTWREMRLPNDPRGVTVDPNDGTVLYAVAATGREGPYGVYRSVGAELDWRLRHFLYVNWGNGRATIAVSPADRALVYLYLPGARGASGTFLRSRDGGAYWDELDSGGVPNDCGSRDVLLLEPHPSEARRLFRTLSCRTATDTSASLQLSTDRGATWSTAFDPAPRPAFPVRLVGGRGAGAERFYLAATSWRPGVQTDDPDRAWLFRSDDGGGSWTEMGTWWGAPGQLGDVGGLAYDPAVPDWVYLAPGGGGVLVSWDGGETWSPLGQRELPRINDLALSADGSSLYAATDGGVFRLRVR